MEDVLDAFARKLSEIQGNRKPTGVSGGIRESQRVRADDRGQLTLISKLPPRPGLHATPSLTALCFAAAHRCYKWQAEPTTSKKMTTRFSLMFALLPWSGTEPEHLRCPPARLRADRGTTGSPGHPSKLVGNL